MIKQYLQLYKNIKALHKNIKALHKNNQHYWVKQMK